MNDDSKRFLAEISQWGQCLSAQERHTDIPVWFCTNRKRDNTDFGLVRSNRVEFGRLSMRIPLSFQFGQAPSSVFLTRMFRKDPIRKIEKIFLNCLSLEEMKPPRSKLRGIKRKILS
jgi:hypothetical protein